MPLVGFEPAIPAFERENIFHALDRTIIVSLKYDLCLCVSQNGGEPQRLSLFTLQFEILVVITVYSKYLTNCARVI
jgi:hypothetical protein